MFKNQGEIDGKLQGFTDAENNLPAKPKPSFKYALFSNSYIKSYIKQYYIAYNKAEYDKDFLRRQTLMRDRSRISHDSNDRGSR